MHLHKLTCTYDNPSVYQYNICCGFDDQLPAISKLDTWAKLLQQKGDVAACKRLFTLPVALVFRILLCVHGCNTLLIYPALYSADPRMVHAVMYRPDLKVERKWTDITKDTSARYAAHTLKCE